ncbi:MAG: protoporphyrinogen oxidase [Deltaproteobacteria bacterium RIFOXYD12_FULL_57_12]|nr:MAG: protoporphyrinogen oxidase [Deltaproteobacteria bacterium RIFOXYD12_FULL_57_12]
MDKPYDVVIIGAGLSGLALAHFIKKMRPQTELLILEKDGRPGGAIRSHHEAGYLAEWGPHGFLDNAEASREILTDTGLDAEAQKAPLGSFVRYICQDGRLALIPQNPRKIIASNLLPLTAKLRVVADLWRQPQRTEQTVGQWAAHRFGARILPFVDAVFTGTYAGDIDRLSIDAVMPGIRRLELAHGSVFRGLLAKRRQMKKTGPKKNGLPAMVSFPAGMEQLVERLADPAAIRCHCAVHHLTQQNGLWEVRTTETLYQARAVAVALSINQALALLAASGMTPPVERLPEARIANVVMGFGSPAEIPFGFGYLAPEREQRFALGALFSTHMFPGRAPAGRMMLEALVGGRRHPERVDLPDDQLIRQTYEDLRQLIHLPEPPCFARVLRPGAGIPQLELGYPALLAWRDRLQQNCQGLYICGFGWEGIGINDMTKAARATATALGQGTAAAGGQAAVKGIYF